MGWRGFLVRGAGRGRKVVMTKLYNVWSSMKSRCNNPKHHAYERYGLRGIYVCLEWHDFGAFREWAVANGYHKGLLIDRIDNDGPYAPSNCRWTTSTTSMRNRSTVKLNADMARQIKAATGTQAEIASRFGIVREHVRDIRLGKRWRDA